MNRVQGFTFRSGHVPVFDFIRQLTKPTQAKVARLINYLEICGHTAKMPHARKLAANLFELRIRGDQEVRILYTINQDKIILLHGFIKKTNKIPDKELAIARSRLDESS